VRHYEQVKAQGYARDELCVAFVAEYVRRNIDPRSWPTRPAMPSTSCLSRPVQGVERRAGVSGETVADRLRPGPQAASTRFSTRVPAAPAATVRQMSRLLKTVVDWMAALPEIVGWTPPGLCCRSSTGSDDQIRRAVRAFPVGFARGQGRPSTDPAILWLDKRLAASQLAQIGPKAASLCTMWPSGCGFRVLLRDHPSSGASGAHDSARIALCRSARRAAAGRLGVLAEIRRQKLSQNTINR
jgi:hypothetical protein